MLSVVDTVLISSITQDATNPVAVGITPVLGAPILQVRLIRLRMLQGQLSF
jgi:hypothetical protein